MKNLLTFFCFLYLAATCFAQNNKEGFYLFKENWTAARNINNATYFMQKVKESDIEFVCRYYQKSGPMIRQESYKDEKLEMPNGVFIWYNHEGKIDSMGNVVNNVRNGKWNFYDQNFNVSYSIDYENGVEVKKEDFRKKVVSEIMVATKVDSIPKTGDSIKVYTVVQIPAQFPGGTKGWQDYLSHNMKTPDRFINMAPKTGAKATNIVTFIISKSGKIEDVILFKSCEWSVDMETLRVIKNAPDWKPAVQNGREVIYRHRQNVTYTVSP
jgi:protein TonB